MDEHSYISHFPKTAIFLVVCVATGVASLSFCSRSVSTSFMFLLAFVVGRAAMGCFDTETIREAFDDFTWVTVDAEDLMFALLPALVFETAYAFDVQDFRKYRWQVFALGGLCYLANTALLAFATYLQTALIGVWMKESFVWPMPMCWWYASVTSPVDPISATTMLHHVGVPHQLYALTKGEALISNGLALFAHDLVAMTAQIPTTIIPPNENPVLHYLGFIGRKFGCLLASLLIGYIFGRIAAFILRSLYTNVVRENAVLIVFVYGTYAICSQIFCKAGIFGILSFTQTMNAYRKWMNREQFESNKRMWTGLAFYSNSIIVVLVGLSSSIHFDWSYVAQAAIAYPLSVLCRACVLIIFTPLLRLLSGGRFPVEYSCLLIWGGVRGSVSLLLAFEAYRSNQEFMNEKLTYEAKMADLALWLLGTTSAFGHFFQGITIGWLAKKLGLAGISPADRRHLIEFATRLNEIIKEKIAVRKSLPRYAEADWSKIEKNASVRLEDQKELAVDHTTRVVDRLGDERDENEWRIRETLQRMCDVELWKLSHFGALSIGLRYVQQAIAEATDTRTPLKIDRLFDELQPFTIWRRLAPRGGWRPKWLAVLIGERRSAWIDCWHLFCCTTAWLQVMILDFILIKNDVSSLGLFVSGLLALFNAAELILRVWMQRKRLRRIYVERRNVLDWLYVLSFPCYLATLILHLYIYHACPRQQHTFFFGKEIGGEQNKHLWCSPKVRWSLIGVASIFWLKLPLAVLLFARIAWFEFGRCWENGDETTFEVLHALITISNRLIDELQDGELSKIEPDELRQRLIDENKKAKKCADDKLTELYNRRGGTEILIAIKTRRAAFELLYDAVQFFEAAKQLGEVNESEYKTTMNAVERLRTKAQQWTIEKCTVSKKSIS